MCWIPDKAYIVLGASNNPTESLHEDKVREDNITVLKRPSGGQTVMLTPNNLIVAAVFFDQNALHPKDVFQHFNQLIISSIEKTGLRNLTLQGISDIAILGRKISGSAIYRSKDALLYHAVINIGESASTFEKYLKHPTREPDYRNGRTHSEFVTSLRESGYTQSYHYLESLVVHSLEASLKPMLSKSDN